MSEANQTAPTDAREASMSRVTTLDKLIPPAPDAPPKAESEPKGEERQADEGQKAKKKSFNERMSEVTAQRNAAREEAERARAEKDELRAKLEALQVKAEPIEASDRPDRAKFSSQEDYEDALTDWKADQRIAKREREQAEAQAKAEFAEVTKQWTDRCEEAKKEIEDFATVMDAADIQISDVVHQALLRSKNGPQLAYFLAKHPDEAKKVNRMHPIDAIRHLDTLERELMEDAEPEKPKSVQRSKAPEPITPVKSSPALAQGPAESFEEHRARRKAQQVSRR